MPDRDCDRDFGTGIKSIKKPLRPHQTWVRPSPGVNWLIIQLRGSEGDGQCEIGPVPYWACRAAPVAKRFFTVAPSLPIAR